MFTLAALLALPLLGQGLGAADADDLITSQYTDRAGFTYTYPAQRVNELSVAGATGAVPPT